MNLFFFSIRTHLPKIHTQANLDNNLANNPLEKSNSYFTWFPIYTLRRKQYSQNITKTPTVRITKRLELLNNEYHTYLNILNYSWQTQSQSTLSFKTRESTLKQFPLKYLLVSTTFRFDFNLTNSAIKLRQALYTRS